MKSQSQSRKPTQASNNDKGGKCVPVSLTLLDGQRLDLKINQRQRTSLQTHARRMNGNGKGLIAVDDHGVRVNLMVFDYENPAHASTQDVITGIFGRDVLVSEHEITLLVQREVLEPPEEHTILVKPSTFFAVIRQLEQNFGKAINRQKGGGARIDMSAIEHKLAQQRSLRTVYNQLCGALKVPPKHEF